MFAILLFPGGSFGSSTLFPRPHLLISGVLQQLSPRLSWLATKDSITLRSRSLHVEPAVLPSPFQMTVERALSATPAATSGGGAAAESPVDMLARRMSVDLIGAADEACMSGLSGACSPDCNVGLGEAVQPWQAISRPACHCQLSSVRIIGLAAVRVKPASFQGASGPSWEPRRPHVRSTAGSEGRGCCG